MGLEKKDCRATFKDGKATGTLHVDSNHLTFHSAKKKWEVRVGKGTSAKASDGDITVRRGSKTATFMVGDAAEKWIKKILNPPTRATKLGLKPDARFLIRGQFEGSFEQELIDHGLIAARGPKSCDIAFVSMGSLKDLKLFEKLAKASPIGVHIWALWPKGVEDFRQSHVMGAAREFGMGPGKKIAFDETYSAMRFTRK